MVVFTMMVMVKWRMGLRVRVMGRRGRTGGVCWIQRDWMRRISYRDFYEKRTSLG